MVNNDKQKLLCLLKILWTRTDRQHILNSQDLIRILQDDYQCSCDRRTVYSNIDALIHAGFKIKQVKGNTHGYYMEERILQPSGTETARRRSTILQIHHKKQDRLAD